MVAIRSDLTTESLMRATTASEARFFESRQSGAGPFYYCATTDRQSVEDRF